MKTRDATDFAYLILVMAILAFSIVNHTASYWVTVPFLVVFSFFLFALVWFAVKGNRR